MTAWQADSVRACVFDFDGTLVDTMQGFADLAGELLEKFYGIELARGRRLYLETSGIPFFQQLEIIRPGGSHNQACAEQFEQRKLEGFFSTRPTTETLVALEALRAGGLKVVVSSNNFQHNIEQYLARRQVPVDLALGFDAERGIEKGRTHFQLVRRHFGLAPSQLLFCGDSLKDGERAGDSGVAFVGLVGTFSREQFQERFPGIVTVNSIGELARLLGCQPSGLSASGGR